MTAFLAIVQLFFTIVIGLYFINVLKTQQTGKISMERESARELEKMRKLRAIKLTEPLSEKTRPTSFSEIVGQEEGIKALRAALCGPNPQHVIIYGPPGVGKTAAARAVLNEAAGSPKSPFKKDAKFIEVDAGTMRFDERGIADPLIGSVHDPIYQGAGIYGPGGIPQPKPGAVTKAHGGILFIDEIGELHPTHLSRLLKVLEDRKVMFESSYYSRDNNSIPRHIHDMFQNGLPADFRLVGATTRTPEEISPAIRSRCAEIFFSPLTPAHIEQIALSAMKKGGVSADEEVPQMVARYSQNGRDAVNIVQTAMSLAFCEERQHITVDDVLWVAQAGRYAPRYTRSKTREDSIGRVLGLAVSGVQGGIVMDIEAVARPAPKKGQVTVSGIIEEEEFEATGRRLRKTGTARAAVDNALCALRQATGLNPDDYQIHINFPGGYPADGPSAGLAIFIAIYSALYDIKVCSGQAKL